ncbi:MAG: efflux RND transporter periplasmic adaptor subunit [Lachnospiraceae bacterium]|nr:efflux RND transporter periplasmic adaptor subunit [Lachnospiraceae bacterium]
MSFKTMSKKKKIVTAIVAGTLVLALVGTSVGISLAGTSEDAKSYRSVTVKKGILTSGVTESGTVDIGTIEQVFDLDMSALQRSNTTSSSSSSSSTPSFSQGGGMPGGGGDSMNMFSQIFNMGGNGSSSQKSDALTLTVAGVNVSVGQEISVGDVLFELEEDTVNKLTEELESNVSKAEADLEAVYADQELSKTTAEYTKKTSEAYGTYAGSEYSSTVDSLAASVTSAQTTVETAETLLNNYKTQLEEMKVLYNDAVKLLEGCTWSKDNTSSSDTLSYVTAWSDYYDAVSQEKSLAQKVENLESKVEQAENNLKTAKTRLAEAKRKQATGKLSAEETKQLRTLAYDTAQETYDITMEYLAEDAADQEETYAEAKEKWEEYSSYISGTSILSDYDGVITSVELEAGDSISTGTVLITLYDMDDVTMTVTVDEDDMTDIKNGSKASILFTAYPDELFDAYVSYIADAVADSSGNVTYDVTVTIEGDVSGLFQGMTGDVTFIRERTETEVLYVSSRAITTDDDGNSWVTVEKEDGSTKQVQVTVGLSNKNFTEISGDIEEGDTILIARS